MFYTSDQACNYLLLTRYPSSSTREYLYHYLIDRNAIGSRPIRNWISLPSLFFFFFLLLKRIVSIFIENHRLIIRTVHFQAISRCFASVKVKKKFQISFHRIDLNLCPYANIIIFLSLPQRLIKYLFEFKFEQCQRDGFYSSICFVFRYKKIGRILVVQLYSFSRKKIYENSE